MDINPFFSSVSNYVLSGAAILLVKRPMAACAPLDIAAGTIDQLGPPCKRWVEFGCLSLK
jgi:hypothetical protein